MTASSPLPSGFCFLSFTSSSTFPISPVPCTQAPSVLTVSSSISPPSRGAFPIHRSLGSPEGDNYRPFLQIHTSKALSQLTRPLSSKCVTSRQTACKRCFKISFGNPCLCDTDRSFDTGASSAQTVSEGSDRGDQYHSRALGSYSRILRSIVLSQGLPCSRCSASRLQDK